MTTKFEKGKSGNPSGRPKGLKDKRAALRELLQPHAAQLVKKAVALALAGDVQALRLCLERLIPPVKEASLRIALPKISDAPSCASAQAMLIAAVATGELLPGEGETLSGLVEHQRKAIETTDVMKRLEALEAAKEKKP